MKNLSLLHPIVDINTVSVFSYNDMDTYRQERLYNLRPDCIADFQSEIRTHTERILSPLPLPIELFQHFNIVLVRVVGLEPTASCVQGRPSTN